MKAVTQNIRVELTDGEQTTLRTAKCILMNFMDIMKDHNCNNAYFESFGVEYDMSNLDDAVDLLDTFSEDNPTIE